MMRRFIQAALILAGLGACSGRAHDLVAPCWRGQPGSTHQAWGFTTRATNAAPEVITNVFGSAQASVRVGPFGSGWLNQIPGLGPNQSGYWDLGRTGTVALVIANKPAAPAGAWKHVWVQVTQWHDGGIYNEFATVALSNATHVGGQRQLVESVATGGGWWLDQTLWRLESCPASETILVTSSFNGSVIDHIVVDTFCASVACPTDLSVSTDSGQCSRSNVTWTLPLVDGCMVTNVVCTPPRGSTFPVGTNSVTCAVTDGTGRTVDCAFRVVVLDAEPPVLHCPDLTVSIHSGNCGQTSVTYTIPASDHCGLRAVECVPPSGSVFLAGTNSVTCVATDLSENSSSCTFQVVVQETTVAYEGDIAGRPHGNGFLSVGDWTLIGRLAARVDECSNACECVKADCAPRPCGNGVISIQDWVQAGRYAAALDPLVPACGPTPEGSLTLASVSGAGVLTAKAPAGAEPIALAVRDLVMERGQIGWASVSLEATGVENALGVSVGFDPALLTFVSAQVGSNALAATLLVNTNLVRSGRLGLALMLPPGLTFAPGPQSVVEVCFRAATGNQTVSTPLAIVDHPIPREVVDATANQLRSDARAGTVLLTHGTASLLRAIRKVEGGGVHLTLVGTPGSTGGLERSTNLVRWERIAHLTNVTGTVEFTDPAADDSTPRFYRAVSP